jgi:hypothetical protein
MVPWEAAPSGNCSFGKYIVEGCTAMPPWPQSHLEHAGCKTNVVILIGVNLRVMFLVCGSQAIATYDMGSMLWIYFCRLY